MLTCFKKFSLLFEFIRSNLLYAVALFTGFTILLSGLGISIYKKQFFQRHAGKKGSNRSRWLDILDKATSHFPMGIVKDNIKTNLLFSLPDNCDPNLVSGIIILGLSGLSIMTAFLLRDIGQLWYVKVLIAVMSLILPYYVTALAFDLFRYHIYKQVPKMVDEFRSAFIQHGKIKAALKECSLHIDKNLGRIISRTSDSAFIEGSLNAIKNKFNNIWLNMFVVLLVNFKENGGELVDQLYKLNKTITRHINIEKKRNKRLIWYELFAVMSSIFSIPAVVWLNFTILGSDAGAVTDARSNIIISRLIGFSIFSLIVIRVLRKL